jgi:hypothetical protein
MLQPLKQTAPYLRSSPPSNHFPVELSKSVVDVLSPLLPPQWTGKTTLTICGKGDAYCDSHHRITLIAGGPGLLLGNSESSLWGPGGCSNGTLRTIKGEIGRWLSAIMGVSAGAISVEGRPHRDRPAPQCSHTSRRPNLHPVSSSRRPR